MNRHQLRPQAILILVVLLLLIGSGSVTAAEDEETIHFSNISDGDTISQLTVLTGTIDFPDFLKYEIFLKSGNNLVWVGNAHHSVEDGNLVRLDPRVFISGAYQLVVRKVNLDSNYTDTSGPTINIENPNEEGPSPYYPEIEPSFLYPSESHAIVRVRNCSGEDFNYDYTSPQLYRDGGSSVMPGKSGDTICIFEDLALVPGLYRGTGQGGGQSRSAPIELLVDEWHVYEILYYGGWRLEVGEIGPDDPHGVGPGTTEVSASQPTATPKAGDRLAQASPPTPAPGSASGTETILPTTGNQAAASPFSVVIAIGVLMLLGTAGVLALKRRQYN